MDGKHGAPRSGWKPFNIESVTQADKICGLIWWGPVRTQVESNSPTISHLNLSRLSGWEGGPCPRLRLKAIQAWGGDRVRLPNLRVC